MPVAAITSLERIEDLTEYWIDALTDNMDALGIKFVGGYDDKIITGYPAVVVGSGNTSKEVSGTHMFLIQHQLDIYICHAEATKSHRQRNKEMLQHATKIVNFIEADLTLGDKIIFGYVINERPGVIQPNSTPSKFVVSTMLNYQATLKAVFV